MPQPITISGGKASPDPAPCPRGGQIQFTNEDADYSSLEWSDENGNSGPFWRPDPKSLSHGTHNAQTALPLATGKTLTYKFNDKTKISGGGGTVKVGS